MMTADRLVIFLGLALAGCAAPASAPLHRPAAPQRTASVPSPPTAQCDDEPTSHTTRRSTTRVRRSKSARPRQTQSRRPVRRTPKRRATASAVSCEGLPAWPADRIANEQSVVELVNHHRARGATCGGKWFGPVAAVRANAQLQCAARAHSRSMAVSGFFDHDDPQGRSPSDRIASAGYRARATGENISAGRASAAAVVSAWMDSPGHCANIMSPSFTEIGVGHQTSADAYGHYWTQNFGRR
ncbi:MAG: CAP domain-containing protein [Deltaproteobacteria bacterium]|nr:CAP domain-containing protein [Deltaproteobacteria bacterium]